LVDVEGTLQYARRYYNGVVRDFNAAIAIFPNNTAAALFGFKAKDFFELESVLEKPAPQVDLGSQAVIFINFLTCFREYANIFVILNQRKVSLPCGQ
jgi:hypothetical protein